jgi:hypothetical protein
MQVGAGIQAGPGRAAWRRLPIVPFEGYAIGGESVQAGSFNKGMAKRRQAFASPLIGYNKEYVQLHTPFFEVIWDWDANDISGIVTLTDLGLRRPYTSHLKRQYLRSPTHRTLRHGVS